MKKILFQKIKINEDEKKKNEKEKEKENEDKDKDEDEIKKEIKLSSCRKLKRYHFNRLYSNEIHYNFELKKIEKKS